jgi:uncharacterized protein (TIGR02147 family)
MIFEHVSYRGYLRNTLAERIQRNPAYSMRAMAQQLGLVSSQLSETMNGKAGFSLSRAVHVARSLNLDDDETEYFCWLVQLEVERDLKARDVILSKINRLRELRSQRKVHDIDVDRFKQISDWYHSAILELALLPEFNLTADSASAALGISRLEAEVALDRLSRLQLIIQDTSGSWKRATDDLAFRPAGTPEALRSFYRQLMEKASDALDTQSSQERLSGYETMAIAPEALGDARRATDAYFEEMIRISKKYPKKNQVYHLLVHLFNLTPSMKGGNA